MPAKRRRGRPRTFKYEDRRKLARLIRRHGAHRAMGISATKVSLPTLLKIAREFALELKPGRRALDPPMRRLLATPMQPPQAIEDNEERCSNIDGVAA